LLGVVDFLFVLTASWLRTLSRPPSPRLVPQAARGLATSAAVGKSQNPHLKELDGDYLYHLGFASGPNEEGKEQLEVR
jgi:hypothetical protein